jgi:hypothetical protein
MKNISLILLGVVISLFFFSLKSNAYSYQKIFIENTNSKIMTEVPVTFGMVFEKGAIPEKQPLTARSANGTAYQVQLDRKAFHPDGTLRHGILSFVMPILNSDETRELKIETASSEPNGPFVETADVIEGDANFAARLYVEGKEYISTLSDAMNNISLQWLKGPVASEWITYAPFVNTITSEPHPHLSARFNVRKYKASSNMKIDFVLENCTTWSFGLKNYEYDIEISLKNKVIYAKNNLIHFARSRWKKTFWTNEEPQIHISHGPVALMKTRAVPAYDPFLLGDISGPVEERLSSYSTFMNSELKTYPYRDGSGDVTLDIFGPMGIAHLLQDMGSPGGRPEIGPLPRWTSNYILTQDRRAKYATIKMSDLAGSWPVHYRDETTGLPVSISDHPSLTIHSNAPSSQRPPALLHPARIPYSPDTAHQPCFSFVPYILTGDFYHLEEMHFWLSYSFLTLPAGSRYEDGRRESYRGLDLGIFISFGQVRSRAWILRNLAQYAAFAPDNLPSKSLYQQIMKNNSELLPVLMNKNAYGFVTIGLDVDGEQPWMDDFLTWATGYAVGLGFDGFSSFFQWKTKFPVQRMGFGFEDNNYCWQLSAPYKMKVSPDGFLFYENINQIYEATFSDAAQYECGSTEFLMSTGFSSDAQLGSAASCSYCYPAVLSIALAAAVDANVKDADKAWEKYNNRAIQPDFRGYPNWAIVPYSALLHKVSYSHDIEGAIDGEMIQIVIHGHDSNKVTAVPDLGYHFVQWSDGSKTNPRIDRNVTGNIAVHAVFDYIKGDVNLNDRIDIGDALLMTHHATGSTELTDLQLKISGIEGHNDSHLNISHTVKILAVLSNVNLSMIP